jgi:hypothetical protein
VTIYFFTILLLFAFAIIEAYYKVSLNTKRILFFIAFTILVLQVGLRWETGTDWDQYLNHFKSFNGFSSTSPFLKRFEYGYNLSVLIVKLVSNKYSFFLLLHAIIYYFLIFKSFQRYAPYLYLSLMLFYTLSMGMMGSNRQLIALAICLYSLRYIIEKKPIKFFLLIFLAINFHVTAILFILYYFINSDIKPFTLILILVGSFVIGKFQLPILSFSYIGNLIGGNAVQKTLFYLNEAKDIQSEYKLSIIGLVKRLIFLSIFYYNRKRISEELSYYNIMLNGYIIGIAFYFLFANSLLIMVNRGSIFFNVMEPLLIASQICLLKRKGNKVIIIALLMVFSFFFFFKSIAPYPDLFQPYKGIFINTDFKRNVLVEKRGAS